VAREEQINNAQPVAVVVGGHQAQSEALGQQFFGLTGHLVAR
jgi:hypothetical protein